LIIIIAFLKIFVQILNVLRCLSKKARVLYMSWM